MRNILTIGALTMALSACSQLDRNAPNRAGSLQSDQKAIGEADSQALAKAEGDLTESILPTLIADAEPNDNIFISPVSLTQAFGLAWLGANGETRSAIGTALGWQGLGQPVAKLGAYKQGLTRTGDDKVTLGIANALWVTDRFPLLPSYLEAARTDLGAKPESVNFGGAPEAAAKKINAWVAKETNDRIKSIVASDSFNTDTVSVLTNAVYFNGKWTNPFIDGSQGDFTSANGSVQRLYLMEKVGSLTYAETDGWQAAALPYGDTGRFRMEVYLPPVGETLIGPGSWTKTSWLKRQSNALTSAIQQKVLLRLPRFEIDYGKSMNAAFKAAGMAVAFDKDRADFSRMAEVKPLFISEVAHATFLRVDELGTEAAAATAITMSTTSLPDYSNIPKMIVDRPFVVALRDTTTGSLLFYGRIANPKAAEAAK